MNSFDFKEAMPSVLVAEKIDLRQRIANTCIPSKLEYEQAPDSAEFNSHSTAQFFGYLADPDFDLLEAFESRSAEIAYFNLDNDLSCMEINPPLPEAWETPMGLWLRLDTTPDKKPYVIGKPGRDGLKKGT